MAEKILNTRILMKIDTLENWSNSSLKLKEGELAFATVAASAGTGLSEPVVMVKIGTSEEKTFSELPWAFHAKAADVLAACKSEDSLKAFINGVIADAGIASSSAMEALAGRVTTAEGKITGLENELNTAETGLKARMTTAEGAIDALETLVGDTAVAAQISKAIEDLKLGENYAAKSLEKTVSDHVADTVAHVTTSDKTKWNGALQASDIAAGSANGTIAVKGTDVAVTGLGSAAFTESTAYDAAGAAATAESNAKAYAKEYADGLAGNYDASGAAAAAESAAKAYAKEYADGLAKDYDAAGSAAAAETAANAYTDDQIEEWVGEKNVATQISEAIAGEKLAETYAPIVHKHVKADITDFAHNHEISEVNGLQDALDGKQAAGDYATKTEAQGYADAKDEAIAAAQAAADKAQEEVDALETYVGTIPSDEKYADITNVIAYVNKKAEETLASASGNSTETAASVKLALENYQAENDLKVNANTEAIADLEGLVGDKSVATQIDEALMIENEDGTKVEKYALDADLDSAVERVTALEGTIVGLTGAMHFEGVVESDPTAEGFDVSAYEMGDVVIFGNKEYVFNNGAFVEFGDVNAQAEAITELTGRMEAVEGAIEDINDTTDGILAQAKAYADGKDTAIEAAQAAADKAQEEVDAVEERVLAVETEIGKASVEGGDAATGLHARIEAAEADIDALEGYVGGKAVSEQISAVTDPLAERVVALEAIDHEHANKTVLDSITADQVTAWDAAVHTVTAGTGLTATKTGTDVAIAFDDSVTFVFDCGDSSNV